MRPGRTIWIVLCLLLLAAGAWLFWRPTAHRPAAEKFSRSIISSTVVSSSAAPKGFPASMLSTNATKSLAASAKTNRFAYRLSNTTKTIGELARDDKAILLDNALIETGAKINLSIPKHLQSQGDPGSYIVQSRGVIGRDFRALLADAGAQIISYIPNNAYLVRVASGGADALAANSLVQSVIPYEPYYKIQSALLDAAVNKKLLPAGAALNLGLFADNSAQTIQEIEKLGGIILAQEREPFGPEVRVQPPADWTALAVLPGVQIVEAYHPRVEANDLSRPTMGVSADSVTTTNYMNLSGSNVIVEVDDTGIDAAHPDFGTGGGAPVRVFGAAANLVDTDGHGTHVAGIIAGDGTESMTVTNAEGSIMPGTNGQFRGKAPLATLLSMNLNDSDQQLQESAALTNALISNNSWGLGGDNEYDLEAASYDAATRDAVPEMTGSQPVLFVFAAGNDGFSGLFGGTGDDDGGGGSPDTISSPATAKDVIAVGALEQLRNITNVVTNADGTVSTPWQKMTDTSFQVAGYSSRGNVGIGTEGTFGRYKPDVVAPGTFVISTRSEQWDTNAYYNVTNSHVTQITDVLEPDSLTDPFLEFFVYNNAVSVTIQANTLAGSPFVALPIYASIPNSAAPAFEGINTAGPLAATPNNVEWSCAASNTTADELIYQLTVNVQTTNDLGDYYQVLQGMNDSLGTMPEYYRYESGTSMAAPAVSGVLALMQDFFTNTLQITPSPALLKAMLINGARPTGNYDFQVNNSINFQGWGLVNLPDSLPMSLTNFIPGSLTTGTSNSIYLVDQSPTNTLSTGDSHTYIVTIADPAAESLPLRMTLAWTDPPGNPAAAIKLVNDLELIVTNMDDPANPVVYYGNDIPASSVYNSAWNTNLPPNVDVINNVQNVFLQQPLGTNYSVTVIGTRVNVNAVTAQTNNAAGIFAPNVSQDYALVVSCGEGEVPDALAVADKGVVSNPTSSQQITYVTSTNTALVNQFVGANPPLLGTNTLSLGTNSVWGTNGTVTVGMTNQWHFYIVTNNALNAAGGSSDVTNAAFITFSPDTLSIPREGVFADSDADSTRPEADIDLYVTTDPGLTNLNPFTISNCLNGAQVGASQSGVFNGAALQRGGTEFVVDSNSTPGQVYYVGVKSEDREAAEYDYLSVFTDVPFSQTDTNGNVTVNGVPVPVDIPDGSPAHPGIVTVIGLALDPTIEIGRVIVTNEITTQNLGDLFGVLTYNGITDVLNSHEEPDVAGTFTFIYDDSGQNDIPGSQPSDGPGSLNAFAGKPGFGAFILTESDNASGQNSSEQNFSMQIQPHQNPQRGINVTIQPGAWFYDFIDVPLGYTNLSVFATNLDVPPVQPPLQLYLNEATPPDANNFLEEADLTNNPPGFPPYPAGLDPGNSISYGPPLQPDRYWIGIFNPGLTAANVFVLATLNGNQTAPQQTDFNTNGVPLIDDAVMTNSILISSTNQIVSVNVGMVVQHPRISDLTFTLVSPTGQRILLMENRGGYDTNGAGSVFYYTNILNSTATGGAAADTNYLAVDPAGGTIPITYNFYTVPDEMTVYDTTNANLFTSPGSDLLLDTGFTNNPAAGAGAQNTTPVTINVSYPPGTTAITIIMNQFGNPYSAGGDAWTYTAGAQITNYQYLVFTEDTNLATVPMKFSQPPYSLSESATNYALSDFELATNGDYLGQTNIYDAFGGWLVPSNLLAYTTVITNNQLQTVTNILILTNNLVSVVSDPADSLGDNAGSNFLALADGTITRTIATVPNRLYNVTFWYRGPGIASWWRGEGDATDSSDPEKNANNGSLIGRFDFPAGEVGQSFQFEDPGGPFDFPGTNNYVQIRQSSSLDVGAGGGFTIEGWINPTNLSHQQPLVEWLSQMPTNGSDTNLVIEAGPFLDRATSHYYYLLRATNWTTSENWATQLGGNLATVDTANEENWIYDTFAGYAGTNRGALWIGLNDTNTAFKFVYSSGLTNVVYTNWANAQPSECTGNEHYVAIVTATNAESGLWVVANNNGISCPMPTTNITFGVVEVNNLQTNGVQFWISVTNTPGTTNALVNPDGSVINSNGCLYADIVDVSNASHQIFSAPGLLQTNIYQYVALTFNTNSGIAALYLNGTNVATTNLFMTNGMVVPFVPKTGGDVLLGWDMSLDTNNFYVGEMDEMSIYSRALSDAEIQAIYEISNLSTNRSIGKFDPEITPAEGLAEAQVSFGGGTNIIYGQNDQWEANSFTFTAASNTMPLQISGLEPGMLLDSFAVSETPLGNLYYLPEQSLASLDGTPANGTGISGQTNAWTLEIWDNRTGAIATNADLVNWQLQFVLQTNVLLNPLTLAPQDPTTITVPPGQTVYLSVAVPSWANFATNILDSATAPVNLYFNQTTLPTGTNPNDFTLLANSTGGIGNPVLSANPASTPPLLRGQTYYLGVNNPGTHAVTAVVEVDFDITTLTNGVPFTSFLNTNDTVRYFAFDVSSNAFEATFQLLHMDSNADLVIRKGAPLPTLVSDDYGSFNVTNADENIYVLTNSSPVPLSQGRWYLGVIKRDAGPVNYSVLAKELDATNVASGTIDGATIIDLTNGVPFNFTAGPGAALTNFFRFTVTNTVTSTVTNFVASIHFELYNLSGNGDLTVQTDTPPFTPPFFQSSQQPGRGTELIYVRTNSALTNLAADWYLGVPNNETNLITYTIIAVIDTNGVFAAFPGAEAAEGAGAGALGGRGGDVYHVVNLNDSGPGSLRYGIINFFGTGATNTPGTGTTNLASGSITNLSGARTIVFDISGTINLSSPLVISNSYLTIAGQTAPGGGITVAGQMATVQSAHDVIIRDVRFRRGAIDDSLQFTNVSEVIADHVSAEWSDVAMSVLNSSNVTVQWSMLSDSLHATNLSGYGSLLRYGSGALSFHHNLYADNYNASPRLGDNLQLDFVNNVIYDWGTNAGFSTNETILDDPSGFTNKLNYVCNYLIASTNSVMTNIAFWGGTTNTWIYQTNNFMDGNNNGILDGANTGWNMFTNQFTKTNQFPLPPVSVDEAFISYEKVLDFAGPDMAQRDWADTNIVTKVRNQTGALISKPPLSGMVSWWKAENNALDSAGTNNGTLMGGIGFASGEVGQAFNFKDTNGYVFVPASSQLNVGTNSGFTVEEWINTTNVSTQMPLIGWGTNAGPNTNILAGPILNPANGHYYYLLQTNTWTSSEPEAVALGGHLVTINDAAENSWVLNTFSLIGGVYRDLWTGLYDPTSDTTTVPAQHETNFVWSDGESATYRNWRSGEPNNGGTGPTREYWTYMFSADQGGLAGVWNDLPNLNNDTGGHSISGVAEVLTTPGVHLWTSVTWSGGGGAGCLYANLVDVTNGFHQFSSAPGLLQSNVYQHVALTYDTNSGIATLYLNGASVASANLGIFVPKTTGDVVLGKKVGGLPTDTYSGGMDEVTIYKRALSSAEIQSIYKAGSTGKFPTSSGPLYLDTDQDGIPDFWENTFTTNLVFVPSNDNDSNTNGYTDLEEYDNWLAAPHAVTATNTPVSVDLMQICGETGNLSFSVTNAVNGSVYLTNVIGSVTNTGIFSNSIAVFTPTNNYSGMASFDFFVTNNATIANFGPVTVQVAVSAVSIATNLNFPPSIIALTNAVPLDPTNTGGEDFYSINIAPPNGTNAVAALFTVTNATGPVTLVVNYGLPLPTLSSYDYITNSWATGENILVTANSTPVPMTNGVWYLGVVNVSGGTVDYDVEATYWYNVVPPRFLYPTNTTIITNLETVPFTISCVATDLDTPPLPLTFALVSGPAGLSVSNGMINWTPSEAQGPSTNTVLVSVANVAFSVTNSFTIIVEESNLPPMFLPVSNQVMNEQTVLVVTNAATDPDIPANTLTYALLNPPVWASENANTAAITFTPGEADGPAIYYITNVVTDFNPYAVNNQHLSATNVFQLTVNEVNRAPFWSVGFPAVTMDELTVTNVSGLALDPDIPANTLAYSLSNAPAWAAVNPGSGMVTLSPQEIDGPTTVVITVVATDNGTPPLSATTNFSVTVNEVNTPPVFLYPTNTTVTNIVAQLPFMLQAIATDSDIPVNPLTFALVSATNLVGQTISNLTVSPNGLINWTPTGAQGPSTNIISVSVMDTNIYALASRSYGVTNSFVIIVSSAATTIATNAFGFAAITTDGTNLFVRAYDTNSQNYFLQMQPPFTNFTFVYSNSLDASPVGLAAHDTNLFWIDPNAGPGTATAIFRGDTGGGPIAQYNPSTIVDGSDIASDGTQLFTEDYFGGGVSRLGFDFTGETAIGGSRYGGGFGTEHLNTLTTANGVVYVADAGRAASGISPQVVSLSTNGGSYTSVYVGPPFAAPNAITVSGGMLFVVDAAATNTIWELPVSGGTPTAFVSGTPFRNLQRITYLNHALYVTDDDTNNFNGIIYQISLPSPAPSVGGVGIATNGVNLSWAAPIYDQFQVRWTTNLAPPVWTVFPNIITSTNGAFSFTDTNTPMIMKFYQLILLP